MTLIPLKQVPTMEDREPVMGTSGTVKSVFAQKTGIGRDKDGSIQNILLTDGRTEVKVVIWDRDEIPKKVIGKKLTITQAKNGKGQWAGCTVEHNEYQGKTEVRLNVKHPAELAFEGAETGGAKASPPPPPGKPSGVQYWVAMKGESEPVLVPESELRELVERDAVTHVQREGDTGGWKTAADYGITKCGRSSPPPPPSAEEEPPRSEPPQTEEPPHEAVESRSASSEKARAVLASKHVAQHGNAYKICLARAMEVADWFRAKYHREMPDSALFPLATTLFISLKPDTGRDGQPRIGLIHGLPDSKPIEEILERLAPAKPVPAEEPPAAETPAA